VGSIVTGERAVRDIEWHSRVLQDSNGSASGVLSIGQDITDRLRAERHVAAQYSVTRLLSDAPSIAGATAKLLQAICEEDGRRVAAAREEAQSLGHGRGRLARFGAITANIAHDLGNP